MRLFIIILSTVIFLIVTINMFVTLVIFLAEDYHILDYVNIYEVFELAKYRVGEVPTGEKQDLEE